MGIVFKYDVKNMLPFIMILHSRLKTDFPETIMKLQTCFGGCCFFTYFFILLYHVTPSTHISFTTGGFMILFFIEKG